MTFGTRIVLYVVFFVIGGALILGGVVVYDAWKPEPEPLLLTPADVAGEWPFLANEIEVSCCSQGRVSLVSETGQHYYFASGRHTDRYPAAALARPDVQESDLEAAHAAARRLALERWPEHVR